MECEIDRSLLALLKADCEQRRHFIMEFLKICQPEDLIYVEQILADYKRDFFVYLPNEIVEIIIGFLDWKSLLNCCLVSKTWNEKLSFNFNTFWYQMCVRHLPLDLMGPIADHAKDKANFKQMFVRVMKESGRLERGENFTATSFGPVEIEAIYTYKNIVATATHVVKFWTMDPDSSAWTYNKKMTLQSRAQKFSFNDKYLLASTYFMTVGLYSMQSEQFMYEYIGHSCSVTGFTFDDRLKLIVTGSADGTVKFWPIQPEEQLQSVVSKPIRTTNNLEWVVSISINHYAYNDYLVIVLTATCLCYINLIEKIDDFQDPKDSNDQNTFRFRYNLKILDEYEKIIDLNSFCDINEVDHVLISNKSWLNLNDKVLTLFLIFDNNSAQNRKILCQRYFVEKNLKDQCIQVEWMESPLSQKSTKFLNYRYLKEYDIGQFEIICFGLSFCLFVDEEHSFYLANLKSKIINKIDAFLNVDRKQKFFRILLNSIQEQFVFGDKNWFNGFSLENDISPLKQDCFPFIFYSSRRNECFVVQSIK